MSKMVFFSVCLLSSVACAHPIVAAAGPAVAAFDVLETRVQHQGTQLVFQMDVRGEAGQERPQATGTLAGSEVLSYVWPTTLNAATVGFEADQGILALAATAHPDFDDTPLYDEDLDGNLKNDGALWHTHWVVLVPDEACGKGHLKVKDIPADSQPRLPATWPGLPILIDSPGYPPVLQGQTIQVEVPLKELGFTTDFHFDGVTAGLQVHANLHSPLLCVTDVFDVASGNLSLPGTVDLP